MNQKDREVLRELAAQAHPDTAASLWRIDAAVSHMLDGNEFREITPEQWNGLSPVQKPSDTDCQLRATDATMDNLILVIENIQKSLIAANKPNGPIMDTIWLSDESPETLFDYIEAELQRVGAHPMEEPGKPNG